MLKLGLGLEYANYWVMLQVLVAVGFVGQVCALHGEAGTGQRPQPHDAVKHECVELFGSTVSGGVEEWRNEGV
jgi:hypothetical protein